MNPLVETIQDIAKGQERLARRSYGVIEARHGRLIHVRLRPWPKMASLMEARWAQRAKPKRLQLDVCRLFYNQPLRHRNFLTLSYIESSLNTTLKTFYATLDALDQIAFLKRSDAILAEVTNPRITDRAMLRWGWERHMEHQSKRHWIKRFYGTYPKSAAIEDRQSLSPNIEKIDFPK